MWDECNCAVWVFFGITFLWDWSENYLFQSCGHFWVFQICWHIECSTFTASSCRIWNSSTGIPLPPLALFVLMLPKAHLTSHSTMSGSRWVWVITTSWLSGSWIKKKANSKFWISFVKFWLSFSLFLLNVTTLLKREDYIPKVGLWTTVLEETEQTLFESYFFCLF